LALNGASKSVSDDELRVATYNLRNYLVMDRYFDDQWRPEYPKPEIEKTAIRRVITGVAPDILVLQELGGSEFLEELRSDLARDGLHYEYGMLLYSQTGSRSMFGSTAISTLNTSKVANW
jgi:endonuclease/exonuclease/phosphatase family metal-dependent hydrolase